MAVNDISGTLAYRGLAGAVALSGVVMVQRKAKPKPRKPTARKPAKPRKTHDTLKSFEKTLKVLRDLGRINDIDAARVQHVRSMARALDERPFNAALWKNYGEALEKLMAHDDDDDDLAAELQKLSADPRNASKT